MERYVLVFSPRAANTGGAVQRATAYVEAGRYVQGRESVEVEAGGGQTQSRKQRPRRETEKPMPGSWLCASRTCGPRKQHLWLRSSDNLPAYAGATKKGG